MQAKQVTLAYFATPRNEPERAFGVRRGELKYDAARGDWDMVFSRKYYCLFCGHVFGRIEVSPPQLWSFEMGVCAGCPRGHLTDLVPGSMLKFYSLSYLHSLPQEFIHHEFQLHLDWALKEFAKELA